MSLKEIRYFVMAFCFFLFCMMPFELNAIAAENVSVLAWYQKYLQHNLNDSYSHYYDDDSAAASFWIAKTATEQLNFCVIASRDV